MPSFATRILLRRNNCLINWDEISYQDFKSIETELNTYFGHEPNYLREDGSITLPLQLCIKYVNKPFNLTSLPDITAELVGSAIATEKYKEAGIKSVNKCGLYYSRYVHLIPAEELTPKHIELIGGSPPPSEPVLDAEGYVAYADNIEPWSYKYNLCDLLKLVITRECGDKAFKDIIIDYEKHRVKFAVTKKQQSPLHILKGKLIIVENNNTYLFLK
jgi:hypothetical protein